MAKVSVKLKLKGLAEDNRRGAQRVQLQADMAALKGANAAEQKAILGRLLALLDELLA